jgi:hypothetical protein
VSPERRAEILKGCDRDNSYFICHVSSIRGGRVCCHGYYEAMKKKGPKAIELAHSLGMIEFTELPEEPTKFKPYREFTKKS